MSDLSTISFFKTAPHPCSYLEDRQATTLFLNPAIQPDMTLQSSLSRQGFRRSGNYIYRPWCQDCMACLPCRIRVADFTFKRRFKRIFRYNQQLTVSHEAAAFHSDYYQLYRRYIARRHADGDMFPASETQFEHFLLSQWGKTDFICFRQSGQLLAVAVTDQLDDGLSAVYCFFDPDVPKRSLGTHAILWQIERCRALGLPYLYLGYLVRESRKMAYKESFAPLEIQTASGWQTLQTD